MIRKNALLHRADLPVTREHLSKNVGVPVVNPAKKMMVSVLWCEDNDFRVWSADFLILRDAVLWMWQLNGVWLCYDRRISESIVFKWFSIVGNRHNNTVKIKVNVKYYVTKQVMIVSQAFGAACIKIKEPS